MPTAPRPASRLRPSLTRWPRINWAGFACTQ